MCAMTAIISNASLYQKLIDIKNINLSKNPKKNQTSIYPISLKG
jgi:hypothetical protein